MNAAHIEQLDRRQYLEDADWARVRQEYQLVAVESEAESLTAALSSNSQKTKNTGRRRRAELHDSGRCAHPEFLLCKWTHQTRQSDVHHWWVLKAHVDRDYPKAYAQFLKGREIWAPEKMKPPTTEGDKSTIMASQSTTERAESAVVVCQGLECSCTRFIPRQFAHLGLDYAGKYDECADCDHVADEHLDWRQAIANKKARKGRSRSKTLSAHPPTFAFAADASRAPLALSSPSAPGVLLSAAEANVTMTHASALVVPENKNEADPSMAHLPPCVPADVSMAHLASVPSKETETNKKTEPNRKRICHYTLGRRQCGCHKYVPSKKVMGPACQRCGHDEHLHDDAARPDFGDAASSPLVSPGCGSDDDDDEADPDDDSRSSTVITDEDRQETRANFDNLAQTWHEYRQRGDTDVSFRLLSRDPKTGWFECEFALEPQPPPSAELVSARGRGRGRGGATGKSKGKRTTTKTTKARGRTRKGAAVPRVCHVLDEVAREWIQEKFPEALADWEGLSNSGRTLEHGATPCQEASCAMDKSKDEPQPARRGSQSCRRNRELEELRKGQENMARFPREKTMEDMRRSLAQAPARHSSLQQETHPIVLVASAACEQSSAAPVRVAEAKTHPNDGSSPTDMDVTPEDISQDISHLSVSGSCAPAVVAPHSAPGETVVRTFEDLLLHKPKFNIAGEAYMERVAALCKLDRIVEYNSAAKTYANPNIPWRPKPLKTHLLAFGVSQHEIDQLAAQGKTEALLEKLTRGTASKGAAYRCSFKNKCAESDELVVQVPAHLLSRYFSAALRKFGLTTDEADVDLQKQRRQTTQHCKPVRRTKKRNY